MFRLHDLPEQMKGHVGGQSKDLSLEILIMIKENT